jgi:nicotinamidase/pyrazinamidase
VPEILLIVDVQNDFLPGGALPVPFGNAVRPHILDLAEKSDLVIATRDWHPPNHSSFESNGGRWPTHCVAGTSGAALDPAIDKIVEVVFSKGMNPDTDGYSGFIGTTLLTFLDVFYRKNLTIVGLATDYCVRATALQAAGYGFDTTVDTRGCRGISPDTTLAAIEEMREAGVYVT